MSRERCPFCGSGNISTHSVSGSRATSYKPGHRAVCKNCEALGPPCAIRSDAYKAWDHRYKKVKEQEGSDV